MSRHLTILTGASRGMGLAMAEQLLKPTDTLLCISRSKAPASLQDAADAASCTLFEWQHDLSDCAGAGARLREWLSLKSLNDFGSATLINNAGVLPRIAPLSESDAGELSKALRVGLEAPMLLTSAFLGETEHWLVPRKVLNISSGLGRRPMASQAAYCAAKAGMDHFTRCVALDEAQKAHGARLCSLAPGVIDTDMQVQLRSTDPALFPDVGNFAQLKEGGQLSSPKQAAERVLAWLERPDFGEHPVADVRDA